MVLHEDVFAGPEFIPLVAAGNRRFLPVAKAIAHTHTLNLDLLIWGRGGGDEQKCLRTYDTTSKEGRGY